MRTAPALRFLLAALCWVGAPLAAQTVDPVQARHELDSIRREKQRLQDAQRRLQGQVTDANALMRNYAQQRDAQNRLVNIIERQISGLNSQLERSAAELALAQDNLVERKAVLNRRLADIYKRGPLRTVQVLLGAESFGDLVARYKYLYLTSRQDRALLEDVNRMTLRVAAQRGEIVGTQNELTRKQQEREAEMEHYADLADEQSARAKASSRTLAQTASKITELERAEEAKNSLLERVAGSRRAANATRPADAPPPAGRLTTADIGNLEWPVEGEVVQRFGLNTLKSGGVVPNHGIAIAAPKGTPVRAIGAGRVAAVDRIMVFGLSVIIAHGETHLSLYMRLQSSTVKVGQEIAKGAIIGTVGGDTELGSHLWFEIRGPNQMALDPIDWLRKARP